MRIVSSFASFLSILLFSIGIDVFKRVTNSLRVILVSELGDPTHPPILFFVFD